MKVVIVESPGKVASINKYLGSGYRVLASVGHIRDLPSKDGSVDPDADFAMSWETDPKKAKRVAEIAEAVRGSDAVILATDPDREGEAISWHVLEVLKLKRVLKDKKVERVVFNAITKDAVLAAMKQPRGIDVALVDAYLARRALDYLVGFSLSPVLWRKLPGARSAGRVQSVTLRLVCDREMEIERFVTREYWSLVSYLLTKNNETFSARLVGADGKKITRLDIGTGSEAQAFREALESASFTVTSVEAKPARRNPYPPFTTSTLQQEASRKFGFAPARTMQIAQRLYEGVAVDGETVGLITYMRTDGVDMAPEAITGVRKVIGKEFGDRYLPDSPRKYTVKAKNAQEAHEAVRPTDPGRLPKRIAGQLEAEQAKLYELIWNRTVASQMPAAELERTTIDIVAEAGSRKLDLRATGQVVRFDGFLVLYQESRDDDEDEESGRLPAMARGDRLKKDRIEATQHFTEPPPRYTEATLIKRMEELGIGRPSTYASTMAVLRDREYVRVDKKRLVPEDKGRLVTAFLESFFTRYVQYDFTADLEEKLDRISNHEIDWKDVLRDFWKDFTAALAGTKDLRTSQVLDSLNEVLGPHIFPAKPDGSSPRACPTCGQGQLSLKLGKFGAFIGCSNYPECKFTRTLGPVGEGAAIGGDGERPGVKVLGKQPDTGDEVTLRDGRFGAYVQLGEGEKPKRSSLPKNLSASELTLEQAVALLSLPRTVAKHPTTGEPILANIGKFGPYVQHGKTYANLGRDDDVLAIGGNRAIDLIVGKESGATAGRGRSPGKVLGDHPEGGAVTLKEGRYGAYVNHGKINATLPKGTNLEGVTLGDALTFIKTKASGDGGGVDGRVLGAHPDGGAITVRDGRYGPYVSHGKIHATLPKSKTPDDITLEEAIRLIEDKAGAGSPPVKKKNTAKVAGSSKASAPKKAVAARGAPSGKQAAGRKTLKTASSKKPTRPAPTSGDHDVPWEE